MSDLKFKVGDRVVVFWPASNYESVGVIDEVDPDDSLVPYRLKPDDPNDSLGWVGEQYVHHEADYVAAHLAV